MKFLILNTLLLLVFCQNETVIEDEIEWTKVKLEDLEQPIENLQGGEGITNYGNITYGITKEMADMFKTLHDDDYDITTKPIIRSIALQFFESNFNTFCNTKEFFEKIIYEGSNIEYNTINMIYHVQLTTNEYLTEFSLRNWNGQKNDFDIKEFTKCSIYEKEKKQDL